MYVVFTPPPSGLLFYFVVLPKPPFLTASASSSTVIPYSTKIPCIKPVSYTHLDVYKRQVRHPETEALRPPKCFLRWDNTACRSLWQLL